MTVFVDKNAEIIVTLYVYRNPSGKLFAWTQNLVESKPEDVNEATKGISEYKLVFRLPTYRDNIEMMDSAVYVNQEGKIKMSSSQLMFFRFTRLLKTWNFTDDKGEIVPINEQSIAELDNAVGQAISSDLDKQIMSR